MRLPTGGALLLLGLGLLFAPTHAAAQGRPNRPVLHGQRWVAITGKPLAAEAGARTLRRGGNAVDAACAMLAATSTMWDVLSWGGETQALVFDPRSGRVVGINGLGVAPSGATAAFFREKGMRHPPEYGPLAAVTPGTPGALFALLAEFGTLTLAEVLEPAIELADGYPIEASTVAQIERHRERLLGWERSREVFLPNRDAEGRPAPPRVGQIFRQPDLARTLRRLVEAERTAIERGAARGEAIYAARDLLYRGELAREFVAGVREAGGLITLEDLQGWEVKLEEPAHTTYRGHDVYKLTAWTQGPAMLQMLNLLEPLDVRGMGYNSARYTHTLYQAMSLAFADRDFYYGDPYFPPAEPLGGLLSKEYAAQRAAAIDPARNDPCIAPGDPYPFQGESHPFRAYLDAWPRTPGCEPARGTASEPPASGEAATPAELLERFTRGTTSIQAADRSGWVVSVTPSGGWIPAVIAGRTGIGLSQRMQSFVLDSVDNPYNVVEPGKRPRVTLTPSLVLKDGLPLLSFSIQGGDFQDQNGLQFFLDVVEFGMDVQEAAEAANFNTYQLHDSFGEHGIEPGRLRLNEATPPWVREELRGMGYRLEFGDRTSGPMTAIWFDREHGTMWGAASDYDDAYGIAW